MGVFILKSEFFSYKNKPLVRKDNVIYYGEMNEDFVAMLTINSHKSFKDIKIGNKVFLQLISTDPKTAPEEVVVKHTVKNSLYEALDIAGIWIERYKKKVSVWIKKTLWF